MYIKRLKVPLKVNSLVLSKLSKNQWAPKVRHGVKCAKMFVQQRTSGPYWPGDSQSPCSIETNLTAAGPTKFTVVHTGGLECYPAYQVAYRSALL